MEELGMEKWLTLNAELQKKKNALRKSLKERGTLKRAGKNDYDNYSYFSEAQYKELFTELFADHRLELKFTEAEYTPFDGTGKQVNGRMVKLDFELIDIDTGLSESTTITGEGMDKGDKAGYKAYTGALKYYLANTFMVATGDDAEKESPAERMNAVADSRRTRTASPKQLEILKMYYTGDRLDKLLSLNNISRIEDISMEKASELIGKLKREG